MGAKKGSGRGFSRQFRELGGGEPWKATLSTEFLKFLKLSNISASPICGNAAAEHALHPWTVFREIRALNALASMGNLASLKNPRFNSGCDTIRTAAHIH
jgi:hypothetical protein